jgi:signal transduction histidine kinase
MRTLFVKLFLWFWLASTISGLISFILAVTISPDPHTKNKIEPLTQALLLYGRTAAAIHEESGKILRPNSGTAPDEKWHPYLFAGDGTPLSSTAPEELRSQVRQIAASGAKGYAGSDRSQTMALRVESPSGRGYLVAMAIPAATPRERFHHFPFPPDMLFRIGVSIIIGGLSCYILARWLTSPVRLLQLETIGASSDEVVDLGREFNQMAERIESLILAQRQLVRDVSHELRSPLARLNVALGLARRDAGPTTHSALDRIEMEGERLNFLIGDLLTLSLLEGGGDILAKTPFSLCELAKEVTDDADFEAASLNRQVLLVTCRQTELTGNRELLRRALENIVRNGVRYTKEGTNVEVNLGRDPSGQALLRVRDHGPGVPDAALADIFRPFYRVAADRDRHSGGAGIGLAIAQRTVQLSGGTILARNVPGGGLEIEMRLPLE